LRIRIGYLNGLFFVNLDAWGLEPGEQPKLHDFRASEVYVGAKIKTCIELGMVSEVVDPPDRLRAAAQELAEKIARNSPAAMAATKRALWGALELGLTDACRNGARELVSMWGHPDQEEGPRAFAEKREPEWQPLERPRSGERSAP